MITVQHLTYEYPNTKALDDVSFTVQEGTIRDYLKNKIPLVAGPFACPLIYRIA